MMEKIVDEDYYDLIISKVMIPYYNRGDNITNLNSRHSLAHIPVQSQNPCDLGEYTYSEFPSLLTLSAIISLEKSGVETVQSNPYLALFGRGIIVAVIDTGIDYQHQAFLYNDKTTRILSIWDQTIQEGPSPEGFFYGTEYTRERINIAIRSEDPLSIVPSVDVNGHGTAIASVIAGNSNEGESFRGVIPESELIIVKLKKAKNNLKRIFFVPEEVECYQESDLILGIRYAISFASRLNRPVVICIAMGTNQSSHDGSGALSYYTNLLVQQPKTGITISAGNEGNKHRHYYKNVTKEPFHDVFELNVSERDKSFFIELWPLTPARLSVQIIAPNQEMTEIVYPTFGECREFIFFNQGEVWINNYIFEEETGEQLILMRFQNLIQGIWNIRVENIDCEPFSFHSWLPSGNLISEDTFFISSNSDTTITSPGNATCPLTVTAYNQFHDSILPESGRGYTRTGAIKPDVAAPGYQLPCAVSGNRYGTISGGGCAAALAAGIVGMFLEWAVIRGNYTNITGNDISHLLIRTAQQNSGFAYPNRIWGYGQIDINQLFEGLTNI